TPGIGFPLAAAGICALLYFAPLYLDGLAANWEILLFFLGLILLALEVFVIPGFGVAGITGIVLTVTSLILSLIRNSNFDFSNTTGAEVQSALTVVFVSLVAFVGGLFIFGKGFANSPLSKKLVLLDTLKDARVGGNAMASTSSLIGISGVALTSLRPLGKIRIGEDVVNAKSSGEFISEGSEILVIGKELGYWVVEKSTLV
ncbi:MAG: membrane-bound serine protease (ClpP class), partial [Bacteroidia bacterium]